MVGGLSFSTTVILCNIGLMNGYETLLKKGLKKSVSDIEVLSRYGFFKIDEPVRKALEDHPNIEQFAGIIQTQAFISNDIDGRGIVVKGVNQETFNRVSAINLKLTKGEIAVGKVLANKLELEIGSPVVLAFSKGNLNHESLPQLVQVRVGQIIDHGVHQKDLRFVYANRAEIKNFTNAKAEINLINIRLRNRDDLSMEDYEMITDDIRQALPFGFKARAFWHEFSSLLRAVKVEKFSITVVLQLIIIISLFNVIAFVIFVLEKKKQEIFLLRAMGLTERRLNRFWYLFLFNTWVTSCVLGFLLTIVFNQWVLRLPFLKLPGKIYQLSYLSLDLNSLDYFYVFALVFFWIMAVTFYAMRRIRRKSLLQGLREEFA
jgi:ABC-type lipoprotein release transport system permease subunit